MNAGEDIGKGLVGNFLVIDANTLVDSFQVRRSVESGAVACMAKNGFEKSGRGTFTICAGDVNGRIFSFGMSKTPRERDYIFKIEFSRGGLRGCGQFTP